MFKFSAVSQIWKKYIQKLNDWDLPFSSYATFSGKKERDLTQSCAESPYTNRKSNNHLTTKNTIEKSISHRLRTDLGRLVVVTKAIQLVWLNQVTGTQPFY